MKKFKIKVKMFTNPEYMGSDVDMSVGKGLPTNQIKLDKIYLFEPQDKMEIPSSREWVQKLVSDIKNGKELKPIFVRTYKDGYQIIDGHHRYQAYKLANKDTIPAKIIPNKYIQIIKEEIKKIIFENYQTFFPKEQEYFQTGPSYEEYIKNMLKILPNDEDSQWLFNHHAAELAWEEGKEQKAKQHITKAVKTNPFNNQVTNVLNFIINRKGNKEQLKNYINKTVESDIELKTSYDLYNDSRYGGKL